MDTLVEIKALTKRLTEVHKTSINSGVIVHVERAEYHYFSGKKNKDLQSFTDAIYRCNQAYEGILRDAYFILSGTDSDKLSTNNIEQYFQNEKILNPRVRAAFTNYRKDWRNPSTHDHKLFFDDFETYMAILSVESFVYVMLKQILQSETYRITKFDLLRLKDIVKTLEPYKEVTIENIIESLLSFHKYINDERISLEAGGMLVIAIKSYFNIVFPDANAITYLEKEIGYKLYSDITIKCNNSIVCEIDVKAQFEILFNNSGNDRLKDYLANKKGVIGIQYYYSKMQEDEYTVWQRNDIANNVIYVIYPRNKEKEIRLTTASTL